MLSESETRLLCEVGPDKPMGQLLRRFWLPVLLSEELPEPDADPRAVRILGEDLIVFRDSNGDVGVTSAYCPHRHAHLFWGRNEEGGIRCTYHGWKFSVAGECVDMPNEPADTNFKSKVTLTAYPAREAGGCIWAYMGPQEAMPPELPHLEWTLVPDSHRFVTKRLQLSNWAQAVEGGIDSSHISFLHGGKPPAVMEREREEGLLQLSTFDTAPRFWTSPRDFGFLVAARRNAPGNLHYWRLTPFLLPSYTIIPGGGNAGADGERTLGGHVWVPVDDEHVWTFTISWNATRPLADEEVARLEEGSGIHTEVEKDVSVWDLGTSHAYLPVRNQQNNYRIDRQEQRYRTFTGIKGISEQDMSIQESMGRVTPRWTEHLGTTDRAIIEFRRVLLTLARELQQGKEPAAPYLSEAYRVRSAAFTISKDQAWEDASAERIKALV